MESPHSYILKTHAKIASSSFWVSTLGGPIFVLLASSYRWSKSEITSMPQNLLSYKKSMPLSTTSMATSNDSFHRLPLGFVTCTLFVLVDFCIVFDIVWGKTFSLFVSCWSSTPFRLLQRTLNIMMLLVFLDLTSKSLVECSQSPLVVLPYLSYVQIKKTRSVLV
jgi:hypothetical protein